MSEEIKFNIYDKTTDTYFSNQSYDFNIDFGSKIVNISKKDMCSDAVVLDYENEIECKLLQYTGLKDKNGKEIYKGDIIEGGYMNPLTNEFESRKYLIEYKDGCYIGKLIGKSPYGDTWLRFIKGGVISNIYKNPELLEE